MPSGSVVLSVTSPGESPMVVWDAYPLHSLQAYRGDVPLGDVWSTWDGQWYARPTSSEAHKGPFGSRLEAVRWLGNPHS